MPPAGAFRRRRSACIVVMCAVLLPRENGCISELCFAFASLRWNFKNKLILEPMTMQFSGLQLPSRLLVDYSFH